MYKGFHQMVKSKRTLVLYLTAHSMNVTEHLLHSAPVLGPGGSREQGR